MPRPYSIYDSYQVANSSVIPRYQGSSAGAALQVAGYDQNLYDVASSQADDLTQGLDNLRYLPQDQAAAKQLSDTYKSKLSGWAKAGNYEDLVPQVVNAGRKFAGQNMALQAPIQQRADYQKSLDAEGLGLTTAQKHALTEMSDAGYKGLSYDPVTGGLTGGYSGEAADKNIDMNDWVDKRLKDVAIQMGGSDIKHDNGEWVIQRGNKWEKLPAGRIENLLRDAMATDQGIQGYRNMMGKIAGFYGSKANLNNLDANSKASIGAIMKQYGTDYKTAASAFFNDAAQKQITDAAISYGKEKYTRNNSWTSSEQSIGDFQKERYKQSLKGAGDESYYGIFGDPTTGQGLDVSKKYGASLSDVDKSIEGFAQARDKAITYVNSVRQQMSKDLGKPVKQLTQKDMDGWFTQSGNQQERSKFQDNWDQVHQMNTQIKDYTNVKDMARERAAYDATGQSYQGLQSSATKSFQAAIASGSKISIPGRSTLTAEEAKDYVVVGSNKGLKQADNYLIVRNTKTGNEQKIGLSGSIPDKGLGVSSDNKIAKIQDVFSGIDPDKTYKSSVAGVNSNTVWLPLLDKITKNSDGETIQTKSGIFQSAVAGTIKTQARASTTQIQDLTGNLVTGDDKNNILASIANDEFKLGAIGVDPRTGQKTVQIVIDDKSKAGAPARNRVTTYNLSMESGVFDRIAGTLQQMASSDLNNAPQGSPIRAAAVKSLQFANMLETGSRYSEVAGSVPGQEFNIKGTDQAGRIVVNSTGDPNNPVNFVHYKDDGTVQTYNNAMDMTSLLKYIQQDGAQITKGK